jgi:penicillin G amidase
MARLREVREAQIVINKTVYKMKKININCLFPLIALVILIIALSQQMFVVPPLGKLLDPFIGAVQNEERGSVNSSQLTMNNMELSGAVQVYFDNRQVPHIYAQNTADLYFAQGYVTAFFRLWQMDFITYSAAGRLSELLQDKEIFSLDRNQRRIGLMEAAKQTLKVIEQDTLTNNILTAYTRGVNAYISQLTYKTMPFEYKLLDYKPEYWTKLKSVLVMKSMANTMTGYEEDLFMTKMFMALGEERFNALYPDFYGHSSPVMNTRPASIPKPPMLKTPGYLNYSFLSSNSIIPPSSYNPRIGSNSWAVSGRKTKSGFPILANDPHLNLSMPSIWVEMQLSAPGMNVYGVSIPGAPAVIVGFNENIAWGLTNGSDDVKDWYKLKITNDYKQYELDGKWVDLKWRVEEIKRKGQSTFYDTVYSTVHGPIVNNKSFPGNNPDMMDMALRWELHHPSNEFLTFIQLNGARNYNDYKEALKHYSCPLQNFTFACKDNTIAIHHQGNMAVKQYGEGKFILDGTQSAYLWSKYIPFDSLPQLLNPPSNFVQSANQHPTDANYPYYYNGYYSETRSNRIEQLLESENGFDIAKMEALQLDNTNALTSAALPVILKSLNVTRLNSDQQKYAALMRTWNGDYNFNNESGRLYELWWQNIRDYTWDEFKNYKFFLRPPESYTLLDLIQHDPLNNYFDKQETAKKEVAADIITEAFIVAANEYTQTRKQGRTKWGDYHKVNLWHLTNQPAFSTLNLSAPGQSGAINATTRSTGPSWRMIVELGDRPKAYGIYPGGQTGNPASPSYDIFINDWNKGKYYPLIFYMSMDEAKKQSGGAWTLNKK